jgi:hypothetical protein
MKKALLLAAVVVAFASCTKDGIVNPGFFGKYELRASYGGLIGAYNTYEPGNGNIFQFNSDSTYVRYVDNKLESKGNFHLRIYGTEDNAKFGSIYFDNTEYSEAFRIKADTITIGTTIADGIASNYVKIK